MDKQELDLFGTPIGSKPRSYPGLASVAHKLSDLTKEVADLERDSYELKSIRATLLLNFGSGSPSNYYGVDVAEGQSTTEMLLVVLGHLVQFHPLYGTEQKAKKEEKHG